MSIYVNCPNYQQLPITPPQLPRTYPVYTVKVMQQTFQISLAQSLSLFSIYYAGDIAYIEIGNLTR